MMSKSLNYAYPQKFAEGGDVAPDTRQRLEFTPSDSGGMVRYVLYDDKGREAQSGVTQRKYAESGLFGPGTNEKYNVSFLEQAPAPRPPEPETPTVSESETPAGYQSSEAPSDALTTLQMAVGLQEEDLRYDANQDGRLGADDALLFRKYAELDDYDDSSGFMAGFYGQGNVAPPSEQKSTSYAFVDADGNSYSMGDARPGHDGTSLERAIANVQEHYDFAPGSFTVSVPSEERLVGTYDSDSGSFQAATSDMRDLNGFSALPGEELFPDSTPFAEPTVEEMRDRLDLFPDSTTTMAMGEEDGGGLMPPPGEGPGGGQLTTMAMGEEEGEGLMPDLPRPPNPFLDLVVKPDFVDPMIPEGPGYTPPALISPVVPPPNTGTTFPAAPDAGSFLDFYNDQPPVNAPVFSPGPVNTSLYDQQTQGRTYGAGSGTPMGPTNSIQPFTPYMPPQQAQGADLQSLITDTDYLLNNSGPRTSVFQRS